MLISESRINLKIKVQVRITFWIDVNVDIKRRCEHQKYFFFFNLWYQLFLSSPVLFSFGLTLLLKCNMNSNDHYQNFMFTMALLVDIYHRDGSP